ECIRETVKESLAEYIFNDYELEMLHHSPTPSVVFTRLWTMKEAVVKLSGRGITGKEQLRPLLQPLYENHSPWIFHHIENQELGYACTIAEDNMDCK
ncbi:MAG: 4'-phosphopantetheinyl transferase superfamily protein, partial [Prevotella sp.]|nr:4'-phosphopantetheinyl transferase superfamily protein [Prevotella sp.]